MSVIRFSVVPVGHSFVARDGNTGENLWDTMSPYEGEVSRWVRARNQRWGDWLRSARGSIVEAETSS